MKIFFVDAAHPSVPGNPRKAFLSQAGADAYAANLVNLLLEDRTDIAKVTPFNWQQGLEAIMADKAMEHYDLPLDELTEEELLTLQDEDVGFVEITEMEVEP